MIEKVSSYLGSFYGQRVGNILTKNDRSYATCMSVGCENGNEKFCTARGRMGEKWWWVGVKFSQRVEKWAQSVGKWNLRVVAKKRVNCDVTHS